jgi:hypothetical protein
MDDQIQEACGICVLHAVRDGMDFTNVPAPELVGQVFGDDDDPRQIHEAVTTFAGTPVCWYHVDDVAKANGI